jgi:uncharacterized membrane protein
LFWFIADEESSKTVGPAGDSLDKREENKVMDDIETSSTSSEKGEELSIMEEGEYSDDDDMNDLSSTNDKNLKENDTNKDRVTVTEVVDTALFFGLLFIFLKTFPLMCDLLL